MSLLNCLSTMLRAGKINKTQHDDAKALYEKTLNDDLFRGMDQATKEAYAALKTAEILQKDASDKKVALARRVAVYNNLLERQNAHPNGPIAGALAIYDNDIRAAPGDSRENVSSVEAGYYRPLLASKMREATKSYESKLAGLKQDLGGVRNMIYEMFGHKTGDNIAAENAKGVIAMNKFGEDEARRLGRVFNHDENWTDAPQRWNSGQANKYGETQMRSDIQAYLGKGLRIFDKETGKMADEKDIPRIVQKAIDDIRGDLSAHLGAGTVFSNVSRTFRFGKSKEGADAYLALMDKYGIGQGNYFTAIQSHAESMARELALLHIGTPSYRGVFAQLQKDAMEKAADLKNHPVGEQTLGQKAGDAALRFSGLESPGELDRMRRYMVGDLSGVGSRVAAGVFRGARAWMTASQMGSAVITAMPADLVNATLAAKHIGLDAGRLVKNYTEMMAGGGEGKREMAVKLGITAQATSRAAIGTKEFGDQLLGSSLPQRMSDFVIRAQGLHMHDESLTQAFSMEMMSTFGDHVGKSFADLPPDFGRFIKDYGFKEPDWNEITKAGTISPDGKTHWLDVDSLPRDLRIKLASAAADQNQYAYLAGGSNRVRALASGGQKDGTFGGIASRSFFLFKQFPMTYLATHGVRMFQEAADGKYGQLAANIVFMSAAGALAIQAAQIVQGKDPKNMKDPWFWYESGLKGMALGFYTDILKASTESNKESLVEGALGPLAAPLVTAGRLGSGLREAAEHGKPFNYGAFLADNMQKYQPGGNLFYTRLMEQRYVSDNIRKMIDPHWQDSFARQKQQMMKLHHQAPYWSAGESSPDRGPDLGAMFH